MAQMPREEIFREYAVVFQDVFSFSFPLAENVSCVREGLEDVKRLEESLEKAGLAERVRELPKGRHTVMNKDLDPEGVTLSGGQMQKMMLARVFFSSRNPTLWVAITSCMGLFLLLPGMHFFLLIILGLEVEQLRVGPYLRLAAGEDLLHGL